MVQARRARPGDGAAGFGDGGSTVGITGALNNSGTLSIGNNSKSTVTDVTAATLDNTGTLNLATTNTGQVVLDITAGAAPSVLAFLGDHERLRNRWRLARSPAS